MSSLNIKKLIINVTTCLIPPSDINSCHGCWNKLDYVSRRKRISSGIFNLIIDNKDIYFLDVFNKLVNLCKKYNYSHEYAIKYAQFWIRVILKSNTTKIDNIIDENNIPYFISVNRETNNAGGNFLEKS
jgi:hypothetical protein